MADIKSEEDAPVTNRCRDMDSDVVVTGLSGRLPESGSVEEFAQQLFAGVDLVTADDRRWTPGLYGLPERCGKLKDLAHFDAMFFGVKSKQAHLMDPQLRILLELTHETIVDAGYNPAELRGSRTGVYVGVSSSESEGKWNANPDKITGYEILGTARAVFSNRISYSFDFKGPSYAIDTACASSMCAFAQAVSAIRSGECDSAIVAGSNLCLNPAVTMNFFRLNMLSPDGKCAAFDAAASGYARSEAVVVTLLQRRHAARRVYATVRGARQNVDGFKGKGFTYPSSDMQRRLAQETLEEACLHPEDITYVEAHGTGTRVGDPQEVTTLAELFCKDRDTPLLMGSVKSNMGHSEAASGVCSIAKLLVAMESGMIPSNLHYKTPNPRIPALTDGRIKILTRNTPWNGGLVALNSFGLGGANAHVILESHGARRWPANYSIPRIVVASGRTDDAVQELLVHAHEHSTNPELHALLDAVHQQNIDGHVRRGYRILVDPPLQEIVEYKKIEKQPLWFVFSGAGSHWTGTGEALMTIPVFAESVARSATVLRPYGVDLHQVLTQLPYEKFDLISSFVSLTATQVALVDLMNSLGMHPDGMIGQSAGEIGCAYADGAMTAEQAILNAYWRGRCILDTPLETGAMAVICLPADQCLARCSSDIEIACYHTDTHVSVTGLKHSVEQLVTELQSEGIFARKFDTLGKAFHSRYIVDAAPLLQSSLEHVLTDPRPRSARWLSSSVPKDQWNTERAKWCNAEYFVNNMVSPVMFADALREIPPHAVVVEVAPHAQLAGMLRSALPHATYVPLVRRQSPDIVQYLLAGIGKLYNAGCQPRVAGLYPPVAWPVSRGTPGLASHVRWDHSAEWSVAHFGNEANHRNGEHIIEYDLSKEENAYFTDHNIDGRILFPATGYLELVWKTLSKLHNRKYEELPIIFENVQFKRSTIMSLDGPVRFLVNIFDGSGDFEVNEGGGVVVTGKAYVPSNLASEHLTITQPPSAPSDCNNLPPLTRDDIYMEAKLRGYNHDGIFRGISNSDAHLTTGALEWKENWIAFMDAMLQFEILGADTREIYLPTRIQRVFLDPLKHLKTVKMMDGKVPVHRFSDIGVTMSGGIEIHNQKNSLVQRRNNPQSPQLKQYVFIPYDNMNVGLLDISQSKRIAITINLQIVVENVGDPKIKIMEAASGGVGELLLPLVLQILETEPMVRPEARVAAGTDAAAYINALRNYDIKVTDEDAMKSSLHDENQVVLGTGILSRFDVSSLRTLSSALSNNGMLLLEEPGGIFDEHRVRKLIRDAGLTLISRQVSEDKVYVLLRSNKSKLPVWNKIVEIADPAKDPTYSWVDKLSETIQSTENETSGVVYAVSYDPCCGIMGLTACIRAEIGTESLRVFYLPDTPEPFSPNETMFKEQVQKNLFLNVLHDGVWGSYRHLPLPVIEKSMNKVEHAFVNMLTRGDLSSLRWIESPLRFEHSNHKLCSIHFAALNFRDVMLATGQLHPDALPNNLAGQECILGLEFSGLSSANKRVMGIVAACGLATSVLADNNFLWEVPDSWSLEAAATVPVAYATAYYALVVRGHMQRGESVLIHAGAGGVGQAAISIALHAGCTVFTTVGTQKKRMILHSQFPTLLDDNIGYSRDTSFEQLIMQRTGGRGVDLVLNSLAQDKLLASVRCLAFGGRFLEIGKIDLFNDSSLGMSIFLKNTTIHGIILEALFDDSNGSEKDKIRVVQCVNEGIASGAVRPLPVTVFSNQELEQAFRYMATGKHIGKVVLQIREEEHPAPFEALAQHTSQITAIPRTYMHPTKSYVVVGGFGGFGLELCRWMITRGATKLVLNSRSGVRTGYQARCIRRWRADGVTVVVSTVNVCTTAGAVSLLREAAELGPVGGVFNLAGVLRNGHFGNLTSTDFIIVAASKIEATKALDAATRELTPDLEHFVVFSSLASCLGSAGQSNYGMANSAMERIVEQRRADGLIGLAVQWGAIGDVGMVVDTLGLDDVVLIGTVPQRISSCLSMLDAMLARPMLAPILACMVVADKRPAIDPATIRDLIVQQVADVIGVNEKAVSENAKLAELGLDSLVGAEVKQLLERRHDIVLGLRDIRALTFARLRAIAATKY